MELWIRSQDKTRLIKINSLKYIEYKGVHSINGYYTNEVDNYDLGVYSTKETALEVLDEIQEAKLGNFHCRCPSNVKVSSKEDTIIYEMPKN